MDSLENPLVEKFASFFRTVYKKEIERVMSKYPDEKRINIDYPTLERFDVDLADAILQDPDKTIEAAELAATKLETSILDNKEVNIHVGVINLPSDKVVNINALTAHHLGKLISIDGVVRQVSDVLPRIQEAAWICRHCKKIYKIPQEDNKLVQPYICECGRKDFKLLLDSSKFIDYQNVQIQEPLETLKSSEEAKYLAFVAEDDLTGKVLPGSRIRVTGILRLRPPKNNKGSVYNRYLEAVSIEEVQKEFEELEVTREEEEEIKRLANDPDIYNKIKQSIAPAIYGHDIIKESIGLQMFGGVKKELPGKSIKRGDIHILLIGDPGTGKSQILQYAYKIAPKSIYLAGKMASGAGLTVTATKDEFGDGGWVLRAGALVLASGGLAAIDELDKMSDEDRSALHEAMAQQTVSVAKAGLVGTFKTETSILAAANPKYGRFDPSEIPTKQFNISPTLMSRFDLYFVIKDLLDKDADSATAKHMLMTQRVGSAIINKQLNRGNQEYEDFDNAKQKITPSIPPELFRKYVAYAKKHVFPMLSKEAEAEIINFYTELRDISRREKTVAITPRQLDAIVRLAEASARIRLSDTVTVDDAKRAIRLMRASMQEVGLDPETGKIDMDIINTGKPRSQIDRLKTILNIVRELEDEMGSVPIKTILEKAEKEHNIPEEKAKDAIDKLRKSGDLYAPRFGFLRYSG